MGDFNIGFVIRNFLFVVVVLIIGYVFARYYPQLGNKVGLP
jgi:hypothetical protein